MKEVLITILESYALKSPIIIFLEILAVFCGITSVFFAKKESILFYPIGLISNFIYIYLCLQFHLLGDVLINIYFASMSIYGWYLWSLPKEHSQIYISQSSSKDWFKAFGLFVITLAFVSSVYKLNDRFDQLTDFADTLTTAIFFVAMWLGARKKIENWLLWMLGHAISIPLYLDKGLVLTSIQFCVFFIIAILGYIQWKKKLTQNSNIYANA